MRIDWKLQATRRKFLRYMGVATVAGRSLLGGSDARAAAPEDIDSSGAPWPAMTYQEFGKTGFKGSQLVFGCGAALSGDPRNQLLDRAFAAGVNVFDVGTRRYYKNAERNLRPLSRQEQRPDLPDLQGQSVH